jgi:phospholipid-transporting ATPase
MGPALHYQSCYGVIIGPFIFSGKDLYEDLKRRKADTEENKTQSTKIESMGDSRIPWMDIRVGQIIRIAKNEFFPCDILILDTSEPKGICYIETKNLDGETNLKQKFAQSDIYHFEQNKQYLENYFTLEYEKPNAYLYKFNGRAVLPDAK